MQIINASKEICAQLLHLCEKLNNQEYACCSSLLTGSSIGKHMRHIIEFYEILRKGSELGEVNYDSRARCSKTEEEPDIAIQRIKDIISWLDQLTVNNDLNLCMSFDLSKNEDVQLKSNLMRELAYNMEHAIHHMALIRVLLTQQLPHVNVDVNFGVAYSTIRYNK